MTNAIEDGLEKVCRSPSCEILKLIIGSIAVFLLVLVVIVGVSLSYSVLKLPPAANFVLLIFAIVLLAYLEALHYACVSIEKWDMAKYVDIYPRAVKVHTLVDTPEKVQKFLVGRQFFVIFVVFLIAEITTFPGKTRTYIRQIVRLLTPQLFVCDLTDIPKDFAGMPELMVFILIRIGLPGVALTLNVGQLVSFAAYSLAFSLQAPLITVTLSSIANRSVKSMWKSSHCSFSISPAVSS